MSGIVADTFALRSRGVIPCGLLLLTTTPIARVMFAVVAFARQCDRTYVLVTLIVLAVLLYSLAEGYRSPFGRHGLHKSSSSLTPWETPSKIVQDALQYGTYTSLLMHSKERGMFRKQKQWKLTSLVACAG